MSKLKRKDTEMENNIEEIELYLWVNNNVEEINPYYKELKEAGYVRIKDTLIYKDVVSLKQFTNGRGQIL